MRSSIPPPALDEQTDLAQTCEVLGIKFEDLQRELAFREAKKMEKIKTDMAAAQRAGGVRRILPDNGDGGGEVQFMVHPASYHYWGRRLGYECWDNRQFVREYLRDNRASRVRSESKRTTVVVNGNRPAATPAAASRFRIVARKGRWAA